MSSSADRFTPPDYEFVAGDGRSLLVRPECGGESLHHGTVTVFGRGEAEPEYIGGIVTLFGDQARLNA